MLAQWQANVTVFLDRDGIVNEEVDLLHKVEQLHLIPGVAEAIKRLNEHGIKVIIVTNQPVVARGLCSEQDVEKIHNALRLMLKEKGACLDAIYYCPHHENADLPQYRKACPDRKPEIGMLEKAATRFSLDLQQCFMVGDRTVDIQTGVNAGCKTILVKTGYGGSDGKHDVSPDYVCRSLRDAADLIIGNLAQGFSWRTKS